VAIKSIDDDSNSNTALSNINFDRRTSVIHKHLPDGSESVV